MPEQTPKALLRLFNEVICICLSDVGQFHAAKRKARCIYVDPKARGISVVNI